MDEWLKIAGVLGYDDGEEAQCFATCKTSSDPYTQSCYDKCKLGLEDDQSTASYTVQTTFDRAIKGL